MFSDEKQGENCNILWNIFINMKIWTNPGGPDLKLGNTRKHSETV